MLKRLPAAKVIRAALGVFVLIWMVILWFLHGALDKQRLDVGGIHVDLPNNNRNNNRPGVIISDDLLHKQYTTETFLALSHVQPSANYVVDPLDLWEQQAQGNSNSVNLPDWMKDYFRWHKEQTHNNNGKAGARAQEQSPYLLLTCPKGSRKCGGLVDRLSPLVFLVYICSKTRRRLLIHWGRPAALEEFLLPPAHGVDWRFAVSKSGSGGGKGSVNDGLFATTLEALLQGTQSNAMAVRCRFQAPDHGADFYDAHGREAKHRGRHRPTMAQLTRTVWNAFFTPAPSLARAIAQFLRRHALTPGAYLATHIRALYAVSDQDPFLVQYWTCNAVNCTTQLAATTLYHNDKNKNNHNNNNINQIFVASDASFASKYAQLYGKRHGWKIVHHTPDAGREPLHLDKASNWQQRPPSDYYDAFVDLYLLGLARCVTYGMGGYGKFASWLTGNPSCGMQHHNATGMHECNLAMPAMPQQLEDGGGEWNSGQAVQVVSSYENLFPPPMESQHPRQLRAEDDDDDNHAKAASDTTADKDTRVVFPDTRQNPPLENLWEASTILPQWMRDYFVWHREQIQLVSEESFHDFRYLVVECCAAARKCGGTSDRLRPIPFYIRLAFETKRILYIHWAKPQQLETFLLPPVGGMDWRTPDWLVSRLQKASYINVRYLLNRARLDISLVQARLQANDHGSGYYENSTAVLEGEEPWAFRRHYHDCWYVLFTPVPAIVQAIERELRELSLVPGHFGVAHIRALYGIETEGRDLTEVTQWTLNAIDCLSHLRGGPYFVASDSDDARRIAVAYGQEHNVHVVARTSASTPVHMDIAGSDQDVASLYDVFIDLYLMSFGRCLSFNVGGFGKWALLLSGHDFSCNIRHWTRGVAKKAANKTCGWNPAARQEEYVSADLEDAPLFLPPMD